MFVRTTSVAQIWPYIPGRSLKFGHIFTSYPAVRVRGNIRQRRTFEGQDQRKGLELRVGSKGLGVEGGEGSQPGYEARAVVPGLGFRVQG